MGWLGWLWDLKTLATLACFAINVGGTLQLKFVFDESLRPLATLNMQVFSKESLPACDFVGVGHASARRSGL